MNISSSKLSSFKFGGLEIYLLVSRLELHGNAASNGAFIFDFLEERRRIKEGVSKILDASNRIK